MIASGSRNSQPLSVVTDLTSRSSWRLRSRLSARMTSPWLMAADLPEVHKDPADRFIIATALLNDLVVVTADHNFPAYCVSTVG